MKAQPGPSRPSVSAVTVNYNGGERTLRCLEALREQAYGLERIVVVDNGSEDGSPDEIRRRFAGVELLDLRENRGLSVARNIGLGSVQSELVLLVDSDIYLEPDALGHLVESLEATDASVACPRIRLIPEREIVQADGAEPHFIGTMTLLHAYRPVEEVATGRRLVPGCIGACYLLHRSRILEAGGFNEEYFFYFEDLEFMLRLAARGHQFVCETDALAFHDRGRGTPGLSFRGKGEYPPRRAYLSMRNRWLTILTHYRGRTLLLLAPALVVYEVAAILFASRMGQFPEWVRAWSWHFRNRRTVARLRRSAQQARVVDDKDLLRGGPLPLAPGVATGRASRAAVRLLSGGLDAYWRLVRPLAG